MTEPAAIEVEGLAIGYGPLTVVSDVAFRAKAGDQLTLLGPSGCGKTTTLRAVAGLEKPSAGRIRIGGKVMFDASAGVNVPAERRGLSMVFQSYAIWPHMTVYENVAYGLRVRRAAEQEIRKRVGEALDLVQMGSYAQRHASQLSGGQQQRVALARACAFSPSVLLFDEPLSNLDAKLRGDMRIELRELQRRLGVTSLYVTHDLEEALAMSDQILVMRGGRIEQTGTPGEIYNVPRTAFVADFVGSSNLIRGTAAPAQGGLVTVRTKDGRAVLATAHGRDAGAEACVSVRTVHLQLAPDAAPAADMPNQWRVTILRSVFLGDLTQTHVRWGESELVVRQTGPQDWVVGQDALLSADPRHCALLEER